VKTLRGEITDKGGVSVRFQPLQGLVGFVGPDHPARPDGIAVDQARPFGEQHGLDPGGHAAEGTPDGQRDAGGAVGPEGIRRDGEGDGGGRWAARFAGEDGDVVGVGQVAGGHVRDKARRVAQGEAEVAGIVAVEDGAGAEVLRGEGGQRQEGGLHEAHAGGCELGQAAFDERFVHAQPSEGDEAEGQFDVVAGIAGKVGEGIGDAGDAAEQAKLVGGGFLLAEDDAAQGGERAGAVVRQIQDDGLPGDVGSAADIRGALGGGAQGEPVVDAEAFHLMRVHRPHGAVFGGRAVAQGEHHAAAGLEPRG
jgi:hypothetical protein